MLSRGALPVRAVKLEHVSGDYFSSSIQLRTANNQSQWKSILVKTGVYREGSEPSCKPDVIVEDVGEAVEWAIEDARRKREA